MELAYLFWHRAAESRLDSTPRRSISNNIIGTLMFTQHTSHAWHLQIILTPKRSNNLLILCTLPDARQHDGHVHHLNELLDRHLIDPIRVLDHPQVHAHLVLVSSGSLSIIKLFQRPSIKSLYQARHTLTRPFEVSAQRSPQFTTTLHLVHARQAAHLSI